MTDVLQSSALILLVIAVVITNYRIGEIKKNNGIRRRLFGGGA